MYICLCRRIREADVAALGCNGVTAPAQLIAALELEDSSVCGRCIEDIDAISSLAARAQARSQSAPSLRPVAARA